MKRRYWILRGWLATLGFYTNPWARRREVRWLADAQAKLAVAIAADIAAPSAPSAEGPPAAAPLAEH